MGAALLAPLAMLLQIAPPLFVTPWFMRIDLVAVPWIICWLVFGLKSSLLSLLISVPLVGVLGPFAGGIVGIVMKSVASIWMFIIPAFFAQRAGGIQKLLDNKPLFMVAALCALVVRAGVTVFFNFYFALPIFFGMTPEAIFGFFTALQSFVGQSLGLIGLGAYIAEISFWNTLQGAIELFISLIVGTTIMRRLLIRQEVREVKSEAHSG